MYLKPAGSRSSRERLAGGLHLKKISAFMAIVVRPPLKWFIDFLQTGNMF